MENRGRSQNPANVTGKDKLTMSQMKAAENSNNQRSKLMQKLRGVSQNKSAINKSKSNVMGLNQTAFQQQQLLKLLQQAQQEASYQPVNDAVPDPNLSIIDLNISNIEPYQFENPEQVNVPYVNNPLEDAAGLYAMAGNKLQLIRETLVKNNKVLFRDKAGKYSTDQYGIRRDEPEYKQAKAAKMYSKALGKNPLNFQRMMIQNVPGVNDYAGTSETFNKFANISYNTSGQILYNNSLIGWKKLVKQLALNKYETRGPVVIYFKRLAQMARATAQLINYINKGKNIQQAIDRENDPRHLLRKKYAALKKYFTNMFDDPNRQLDYDYKMKQIMQTNANKRISAINANYDDVVAHQGRIYDMVMARRDAIRRAYRQGMVYEEN